MQSMYPIAFFAKYIFVVLLLSLVFSCSIPYPFVTTVLAFFVMRLVYCTVLDCTLSNRLS